jgi:tRNA pseudouridine55 synthase
MMKDLGVLTRNDDLCGVDFLAGVAVLVDKPARMTSFGVVARLRRLTRVRKVGHAGTLDPAATGLMILLTGPATRHQAEFMGLDKEYLATILLGVETDTWDLDGEILHSEVTLNEITREQVQDILQANFSGEFEQQPPAYSALKVGGVPSYRLARKGKAVELKPRRVIIHNLVVEQFSLPEVTLRISCGSGFYVRSLAHDLGQRLACGATLKSLVRTRIGPYRLQEAFKLEEMTAILSTRRKLLDIEIRPGDGI